MVVGVSQDRLKMLSCIASNTYEHTALSALCLSMKLIFLFFFCVWLAHCTMHRTVRNVRMPDSPRPSMMLMMQHPSCHPSIHPISYHLISFQQYNSVQYSGISLFLHPKGVMHDALSLSFFFFCCGTMMYQAYTRHAGGPCCAWSI